MPLLQHLQQQSFHYEAEMPLETWGQCCHDILRQPNSPVTLLQTAQVYFQNHVNRHLFCKDLFVLLSDEAASWSHRPNPFSRHSTHRNWCQSRRRSERFLQSAMGTKLQASKCLLKNMQWFLMTIKVELQWIPVCLRARCGFDVGYGWTVVKTRENPLWFSQSCQCSKAVLAKPTHNLQLRWKSKSLRLP